MNEEEEKASRLYERATQHNGRKFRGKLSPMARMMISGKYISRMISVKGGTVLGKLRQKASSDGQFYFANISSLRRIGRNRCRSEVIRLLGGRCERNVKSVASGIRRRR